MDGRLFLNVLSLRRTVLLRDSRVLVATARPFGGGGWCGSSGGWGREVAVPWVPYGKPNCKSEIGTRTVSAPVSDKDKKDEAKLLNKS